MKYRILYLAMLAVLAIAWSSTGARAGGDVPTTFTVDSAIDNSSAMYTIDGTCPTPCTLREAILEANDNIAADTIVFAASLNGSTITMDDHFPDITDDLTITGPGSALLTLDGDGNLVATGSVKGSHDYGYKPFDLNGDGPLTFSISGMTIRNVIYDENGAVIDAADDNVTVEDVAFIDNSSYDLNGLIYSGTGTLTVTDCLFMDNDADSGDGGAIYAGGTLTVTNTDFMGNLADNGGAIHVYSGTTGASLTMTGGSVVGNYADSSGGGIYIGYSGGSAMITGVRLSSNESSGGGGAVAVAYNVGSTMLSGVMLTSNNAGASGGGLYAFVGTTGATVEVLDSSVLHNESAGSGGGLYLGGSTPSALFTVQGSRVEDNEATSGSGGGLYFSGNSLDVAGSSVSDNIASSSGGGIYISGIYGNDKSVEITGSTIAGNTANGNGGGLYAYASSSATATLLNTTVSGNAATGHGGGLYLDSSGGSMAITHGTITDNTADDDNNDTGNGGGIYALSDAPTVTNTIIAGNDDASDVTPAGVKGPPTLHDDCSGSITTAGVNLIGDTTGCSGTFTDDLVGSEYDAGLLALTKVPGLPISIHDLGLASDAINAADPATCAEEDAIGQTRNPDACDIGAVESISLALYLYNEANGGCTMSASESGGISMALLLLAVAGVFAFERRRRRS
ncbi:MAG: hypothetical protein KDH09_09485 [Chrysiogenetes bacterium]|nr:hypothetical protein [Chrysiogenetes bacterium]